ncbi:MAG TPA: PP2C family protein-serine/threonine phosphatase [Thermoanaerobaculia bacterium]
MAPAPTTEKTNRFPLGRILVYLGVGAASGWLVSLLLGGREPRAWAASALVGTVCTFVILALEIALHRRLEALPEGRRRLVRAVLYFIGGCAGFLLGRLLALWIFWGRVSSPLPTDDQVPVAVGGIAAAVIGLLIYTFTVLQDRLRDSVARLKEAEFAQKEIALAREIQERLLPEGDLAGPGWRIGARNLAARGVAGDFFDVLTAADHTLYLVIADVAGKGIGASLIMATVKALLPQASQDRSPAQTLDALNERLNGKRQVGRLARGEFVAMAIARYDPASGSLELANAGMPDPYRLRNGVAAELLTVPGERFPLGTWSGLSYQQTSLQLSPGDRVLFVSDGLPEAPTAAGAPLGYEALAGSLPPIDGAPPGRWLERLFEIVRTASQETREDDWTALLLEHRGETPA